MIAQERLYLVAQHLKDTHLFCIYFIFPRHGLLIEPDFKPEMCMSRSQLWKKLQTLFEFAEIKNFNIKDLNVGEGENMSKKGVPYRRNAVELRIKKLAVLGLKSKCLYGVRIVRFVSVSGVKYIIQFTLCIKLTVVNIGLFTYMFRFNIL